MASIFKCDGCGVEVASPKKVGLVLPRDYCPECAPKAEAFLEAEEKMREDICLAFQTGREKMIAGGLAVLKALPDVP